MAIASCNVRIISRGKGQSAVAAAAYRSGNKLHDEYDGTTHDYTRKKGIVYTTILAPENASPWVYDPEKLWNVSQKPERRKDAQLAREVMIALPAELTRLQNIELAIAYTKTFVNYGMVAHISVHDTGDGNPHVHILLTMRSLEVDGFSKKKNTDWNSTEMLMEWRKNYETITNQFLERCGHEESIDVRSYEEQGIDQIPTIHLGHYAHHLEQRWIHTDRGDINREIEEHNKQIKEINREIAHLEQMVEHPEEKEQDITFHYARTAEHSRDYDAEEYMEAVEPSRDNAEEMIEYYTRELENIRRTTETVGLILTERGKHSLAVQQRNIENALEQLKRQQEQNLVPPPLEGEKHNFEDMPREIGLKNKADEMEQGIRESYDAWLKQQGKVQPYLTEGHEADKIRQTGQGNEIPTHSQSDRESDRQQGEIFTGPQEQPEPEIIKEPDYQYRPPPFRRQREGRNLAQSKKIAEQREKVRDKGQAPEPAEDQGSQAHGVTVHERPPSSPGHQRNQSFDELQGSYPADKPHQKEFREAFENQNPPHHSREERKPGFSEMRDKLLREHDRKKEQEQKQDQKKEQEHKSDFTERRHKLIREHAEKKEQERKHHDRERRYHWRKREP